MACRRRARPGRVVRSGHPRLAAIDPPPHDGGILDGGRDLAYRSTRSWPTITAEWTGTRLKVFQHMPLDMMARALEHPAGTPETNRANVCQIEHVGFTDDAFRQHVGADPSLHVSRWPDARWAAIGAMCREIEAITGCQPSTGIPLTRWQRPAGWRQGGAEFVVYDQHTAHVFAPGNHHTTARASGSISSWRWTIRPTAY
jgi:hypothetical protein